MVLSLVVLSSKEDLPILQRLRLWDAGFLFFLSLVPDIFLPYSHCVTDLAVWNIGSGEGSSLACYREIDGGV